MFHHDFDCDCDNDWEFSDLEETGIEEADELYGYVDQD
jgi:hypothetical protein